MARREYTTIRAGDEVFHIELHPDPPHGYTVTITKAEVGGPPRQMMESTVHATTHEAHKRFVDVCVKILKEVVATDEYVPRSTPSLDGVDIVNLTEVDS